MTGMLTLARKALHLMRREGPQALLHALAERLGHAEQTPTMLTPWERQWAKEYVRTSYRGRGHIVDLGCWLGSSTQALAKGLRDNPHPATECRAVHAYDRFVWEAYMEDVVAGTSLAGKYRPGDCFRDAFEWQVRGYRRRIEVHAGDLLRLDWIKEPIEFLFIDAMKSWELANCIMQGFYPHLIPGLSVIVHQDFIYHCTDWIHLPVWRLREYFDPVCQVPNSPSVVFRCVKPIPGAILSSDFSPSAFAADELEAAYAYALNLVRPENRAEIERARSMCYARLEQRLPVASSSAF
jgi:predicted O-methyltransferase YrrM